MEEGDAAFGQWIINHDWSEIKGNPSEKAEALGLTLDRAMGVFFPLITRRMRSDQDPRVNEYLEKMIVHRKRIFKIQGRSASWKKVKKRTQKLINERKRGYLDYKVQKAEEKGGLGNRFASLTKLLLSRDKKPNFDVKTLCAPGSTNHQAAEECADYFSSISDEFLPLDMSKLLSSFSQKISHISQSDISRRLRSFKKPRSMVLGDIFPQLVNNYADFLSVPLESIYNAVTLEYHWPLVWRKEYVTIIPKGDDPKDLGGCRSISCTNLFSKILESFLLSWSWEMIGSNMRTNQFGG